MTCRPSERAGARPMHETILAALITAVFALLSLPAHWATDFWAESSSVWVAYFVLGAVLSVHVVAVFLRVMRALLGHDHNDGPAPPRTAAKPDGARRE